MKLRLAIVMVLLVGGMGIVLSPANYAKAETDGLTYREVTHAYNMGYAAGLSAKCGAISVPREIQEIKAKSDAAEWAKVEEEGRIAAGTALTFARTVEKDRGTTGVRNPPGRHVAWVADMAALTQIRDVHHLKVEQYPLPQSCFV